MVLDEVHYLADRFRGAVWEEVIIHLPESVQLVALSATVSNAEEFGEWLVQVRGDTTVIVDEQRPVPLWQHMLAQGRLFDLFTTGADAQADGPAPGASATAEPGSRGSPTGASIAAHVNPELLRIAQRADWRRRPTADRSGAGGGRAGSARRDGSR